MLGKIYQDNVCAVVVDEDHCILEWLVIISKNKLGKHWDCPTV
jgi:hypothetical protein